MRPCRRCRAPVENNVATCPYCETAQSEPPIAQADAKPAPRFAQPKVNPQSEPVSQRNIASQLIRDVGDLIGLAGPLALLILSLPVALAVAFGYIVAGQTGAAVTFVAVAVLLLALTVWSSTGG